MDRLHGNRVLESMGETFVSGDPCGLSVLTNELPKALPGQRKYRTLWHGLSGVFDKRLALREERIRMVNQRLHSLQRALKPLHNQKVVFLRRRTIAGLDNLPADSMEVLRVTISKKGGVHQRSRTMIFTALPSRLLVQKN
jgi:hypothetical protein